MKYRGINVVHVGPREYLVEVGEGHTVKSTAAAKRYIDSMRKRLAALKGRSGAQRRAKKHRRNPLPKTLTRHPLAWGFGAALVAALVIGWMRHRSAPALPPPLAVQVGLQPGETTVAVKTGGSLTATLPAGATWDGSQKTVTPLNPSSAQPTGSQAFNISPINAKIDFVFHWLDSSGNPKSTTVHVAVA